MKGSMLSPISIKTVITGVLLFGAALGPLAGCTSVAPPRIDDLRRQDTFTRHALAAGGVGIGAVASSSGDVTAEDGLAVAALLENALARERPQYRVVPADRVQAILGAEPGGGLRLVREDGGLPEEAAEALSSAHEFRYLVLVDIAADRETASERISRTTDDACMAAQRKARAERRERAFRTGEASLLAADDGRDEERCAKREINNVYKREVTASITVHDLDSRSEAWHGRISGAREFADPVVRGEGDLAGQFVSGMTGGFLGPGRNEVLGDIFKSFAQGLP